MSAVEEYRELVAHLDAEAARRWQGKGTETCDCDEECPLCARCGHPECSHALRLGFDDCEVSVCSCPRFLTDDDCRECDGTGSVSVDVELSGGRVLDDDLPCTGCRGSGVQR